MSSLKVSQEDGLLSPLIDNSYAYNQTKKVYQMQSKREEFSKNHYHTPQIALTKMETNRARSQVPVPHSVADQLFDRQDKRSQGIKLSLRQTEIENLKDHQKKEKKMAMEKAQKLHNEKKEAAYKSMMQK